MKFYFAIPTFLFALILFTSCEESFISPDRDNTQIASKGGNKGNKIKSPDEGTPLEPTPTEFTGATYQLATDLMNPLFQFIINEEQQQILLRATEDIGQWGIDYYGYWSEPFSFEDQQVFMKNGLSEATYSFEFLSPTSVQVTRRVIVRSEFSYDVITWDETVVIGTFELVN